MKWVYRVFAILAVCAIAATTGTVFVTHAAGNLVQRSVALVNVKGWWRDDGPDRPYIWLTETSLFSHSGWWRLSVPFTYDVATRTKTPLSGLQKLLGSDGDDQTAFWELSPDRKHIAWNIECYDTLHTASLDGSEHKTWRIEGPHYGNTICGLSWLADGHRWIASTCDQGSAAAGLDCVASIDDRLRRLDGVPATSAESIFFARPVTRVDDGVFEVQDDMTGRVNEYSVRELGLPTSDCIYEVEASPDHKHLALLLIDEHASKLAEFLHHIYPRYVPSHMRCNSLWVSSIDGSTLHEVGRIEAPDGDEIRFLQWMPNGKRITYIYRDEIYGIDVMDQM